MDMVLYKKLYLIYCGKIKYLVVIKNLTTHLFLICLNAISFENWQNS